MRPKTLFSEDITTFGTRSQDERMENPVSFAGKTNTIVGIFVIKTEN